MPEIRVLDSTIHYKDSGAGTALARSSTVPTGDGSRGGLAQERWSYR